MSPEQARGLPVDKRSDIFSFGCVVFEMLTGRKAFEGDLVSDVMAAVIKSEPSWSLLPHPAERFRGFLARCLEKDPKQRLRDIGDARVELEAGARARAGGEALISRRRALSLAAICSVVVAIVTAALVSRRGPTSELTSDVTRFQVEVGGFGMLAFSPDGRTLVRTSADGIHVRALDEWESHKLFTAEDQRVRRPFFSPDGEWVGFQNYDEDGLYKISVDGGAPVRVSEFPPLRTGATWTDRGSILIGGEGGIWEVDAGGGSLSELVTLPNEHTGTPLLLPGGDAVVFDREIEGESSIAIADFALG